MVNPALCRERIGSTRKKREEKAKSNHNTYIDDIMVNFVEERKETSWITKLFGRKKVRNKDLITLK